jgi:hypothetical protein
VFDVTDVLLVLNLIVTVPNVLLTESISQIVSVQLDIMMMVPLTVKLVQLNVFLVKMLLLVTVVLTTSSYTEVLVLLLVQVECMPHHLTVLVIVPILVCHVTILV